MSFTLAIIQLLSQWKRAVWQLVLDILFPLSCFGCKTDSALLCQVCCSKIKPRYEQSCPYCRKHITPHGETCFGCSSAKNSLDGVFVAYDYNQPLVHTTLHAFKYHSLESLSDPLSQLFAQAIVSSGLPLPDCIFPVPLHPWRLRYRGFNQSEILATSLSTTLLPGIVIPLDTQSLIRHRFTLPQQRMPDAPSRKNNIKNAFSFTKQKHYPIKEKSIWLIDDISTTASTLDACAKVLKKSGAKRVFGIVFAQNTFIPYQKTNKMSALFPQ